MLSRRNFLKAAGVGAAAALPGLAAAAEAGKDKAAGGLQGRPNILFLLIDDQRNDTLGCAGHPIIKTPVVDGLARSGVRFRNMFVTTAICAASRASIFTGLPERTHGYTFGTPPIPEQYCRASYPALLRKAGYRTGFIGKFGVGVPKGMQQVMFDYYKPHGRHPYFHKQPDGTLRHETEIAGDKAVEFMRTGTKDKPWCLSVSFNAVHAEDSDKRPGIGHYPWPKAVDGMYENITVPPPRLSEPEVFERQPEFLKKSMNRARYFWRWDTPEKYQTNIRAYFRMISGVDRVIGRVLAELKKQGMAENTVVIYTGDNGYYMGQRGFAGKWSHYEESLRVPLIVYDPRQPRARRGTLSDAMALNIDLPATMLALAGVAVPEHYRGRSLMPLLAGLAPGDWREDFFCEHLMDNPTIPKWEGIRGKRYVYARYFQQQPVYEFLHDLKVDPDQLRNFVADPKYAPELQRLRARCDELRDAYGGPYKPRKRAPRQPRKGAKAGKADKPAGPAGPATAGAAAYVAGVKGKAARFDGRHYIPAGKVPPIGRDEAFSWSLWVKLPPSGPVSGVIVGNRRRGGTDARQFMKVTRETVQYFGPGGTVRLTHGIAADQWTHLAVVKEAGKLTVHVGGRPVASAKVNFDMPELPLYLGGDPRAGELAACDLDEVRLYRRALRAEEIKTLGKLGSVPDGLAAHYPLDGPGQ